MLLDLELDNDKIVASCRESSCVFEHTDVSVCVCCVYACV